MGILDLFRLEGKVALVTGVGRGLGQAMALGLAEAGADIAGLYRTNYEESQAQVEALGRRFLPLHCDLQTATVAQLGEVVDQVVGELGRLDILVNNAGIIRRAPAMEFSEQDWDDVIQVNLKALFFLSQVAPALFVNFMGVLDVNGSAVASVVIPGSPQLKGLRFYVSFVTLKGSAISAIANTAGFTIK